MIKQYRYPVNQITYEILAGKIDKGETFLECITRQLEEETGYIERKSWKNYYPTAAFSNEIICIFAAFGLKVGKQNPDEDEFISREIISFKEAVKMVKTYRIRDSKTIIALLYFGNILR